MRRLLGASLAIGALGAALFLWAASNEVTSLGSSLTRMARDLRLSAGGPSRSGRPAGVESARPRAPGAEAPGERRYMEVSFTATEDDLGRVLGRDEAWLGGWLTQTREVSCRLTEGHILIDSRTRIRVLGVPIAAYAGASSWGLAARPDGVGVRLGDLGVSGIAVPGAPWLLRRLGKVEEGWVVVRTGSRAVVDRIEVAGGKLTVAGRLRRSVSTEAASPHPG
jgi:hypothetical protein